MAKQNYVPDRGDVVWIDFSPQAGHEQGGRRPGVILSSAIYNGRVGNAVVCPVTSQVKGYPFEVPIPLGLPVGGVILADQVKCVDWRARQASFLCQLPPAVVDIVAAQVISLIT
jgi:mRNA interferase MazF